MKPILIDEFVKDAAEVQCECHVTVDGRELVGYQIAKPMNYDPEYFSMEDRQEMANAILAGKAIAVCYFEDLTEAERVEYVKGKLKSKSDSDFPKPEIPPVS